MSSLGKSSVRSRTDHDAFDQAGAVVTDVSLPAELGESFAEYAFSVVKSRALPDARDGLKPVHRRILFHMGDANLGPTAPYTKSARVVGDVMGRYHPHGDNAIYDALVRMTHDFTLNAPLVDGHGNFGGTPDDGPAAARYTECRLTDHAMGLVVEIGENTVDMVENYDGSLQQPVVLPTQFPTLLVNGSEGIAVGMATSMIPHNLGEVSAAAAQLLRRPDTDLDQVLRFIPGPDLPTGGELLGMDGVQEAYRTGRGKVRLRATTSIEAVEGSRGRFAVVATTLPYGVGPERVITKIKEEVGKKKLAGIADVKDLTDRHHGLRLVVECRTGVNPESVRAELFRLTPLEVTFAINNVALVDEQPRTLSLLELLQVWVDHRLQVVTRRSQYRRDRASDRLHIVQGFLIALDAIEQVVRIIRGSATAEVARTELMAQLGLSSTQASHILDMPLRRLAGLEVDRLRAEAAQLEDTIAGLDAILTSEQVLREVSAQELEQFAAAHSTPRRTRLVDGDLADLVAAAAPAPEAVQVADEPTRVWVDIAGRVHRTRVPSEHVPAGPDAVSAVPVRCVDPGGVSTRGGLVLVWSAGTATRVDPLMIPATRDGVAASELIPDAAGLGQVVAVLPETAAGAGLAIGTRAGVVKVCSPDWPVRGDRFDVIALKPGDVIVGAGWVGGEPAQLVFVTSDANVLRFPSDTVRAQGRSAAGMAGVRVGAEATVLTFCVVPESVVAGEGGARAVLVTGTHATVKMTPLGLYPAKGRGTGGVRCQRFLKGESALTVAFAGVEPVGASGGRAVALPTQLSRRDASGEPGTVPSVIGTAAAAALTG